MAGFPHVIATLWQVDDQCSAIAGLLHGSAVEIERTAVSLHLMARKLRDKTRQARNFKRSAADDPLIWAAYAHFGV